MSTAKNCFSGKSNFATTCNRLSLFLKEKGSLKDIGINATFDAKGRAESSSSETDKTTVDLLSKMDSPVNTSVYHHLPQYVSFDLFCKPDDSTDKSDSGEVVDATEAKTEDKSAQMTILYRGQVLVFDRVSVDTVRNMMLAAGGSSSVADDQIQNSNSCYEGFGSRCQILQGLINGSDLPIARRSSLHKFLSKRKDRASERAPYQMPNRLMVAPSSNHNFDLNL